ncbi:MAG TPA: OmpA family protein, partial [Cytophagales bacterium]|nr:OmpA family protein [Cytophagales bacterium]
INNLFFDYDKSELKKESFHELNRLAKLLQDNPQLKVEISGHTDNIGSDAYNDKLSYDRANAVVTYLVGKLGAEEKRITAKYYGEDKPIADNKSAEGRTRNRRVEFKIIAK